MAKINWNRVLLGGLLAGLILNIIDYIVNDLILQERWAAAMKALGKATTMTGLQIVAFVVVDFLLGIFAIWLYSAIRPRYGAGPKTAVCAGAAVWGLGSLLPSVAPTVLHLFGRRLMGISVLGSLVGMILGALVGAWLYKEESGR